MLQTEQHLACQIANICTHYVTTACLHHRRRKSRYLAYRWKELLQVPWSDSSC